MAKQMKKGGILKSGLGCLVIGFAFLVLVGLFSSGGNSGRSANYTASNNTATNDTTPPQTPAPAASQPPQRSEAEIAAERRAEKIDYQFSAWDGSHRAFVKMVKSVMNDPDSFEHVKTTYRVLNDYLIVEMVYRGKNAFNATVTETATQAFDLNGNPVSADTIMADIQQAVEENQAAMEEAEAARKAEEQLRAAEAEKQKRLERNASEAVRAIEKYLIGKDDAQAREKLEGIIEKYPNTEGATEAEKLLEQLK
ncbi:tetratricopeptide repeat protein [Rubinisphaera sp. JC750]|uniref:tetratricopeptide repeat protein n=1 Tax=Rubinisphaera sp. JC750 TaxID=2898658 RepID=UPI001F2AB8AA|nr:hypothetical protein [Rubinisphaera sp. JC750]